MTKIKCRLANADDADLLFSWVNDEDVRNNSFSTAKISYREHIDWFSKTLGDDSIEIYIYYFDNEPIGQVRLKYSGSDVLINYSVSKKYRGQGFGKLMICDIEKVITLKHPQTENIIAKVKFENIASQKIFEDNNYCQFNEQSDCITYKKIITDTVLNEASKYIYTLNDERERERKNLTPHEQPKRSEII